MNRHLERFLGALSSQAANMGWYILLAILVAAAIKTFKLDKKIRHALEGAGPWAIPLATLVGLVSPLCSCGILPVVSALMVAGVPTAPLMALLISSPVMSPDAFVLTWGVLGPGFALGKLVAAALFGLAFGYLVDALTRRGRLPADPWKPVAARAAHHCVDPHDPDDPRRGLTVTINRWKYFALMLWDMTWMIGRFVVLAAVVEALLVTFVPANAIKVLLGRPSVVSVLMAVGIGLPLPLHQVAVVPILRGLLDLGISRGAAMALLMAGPVSSIPAMIFLSGMVDRKLFYLYLAVGLGGSILAGIAFLV